MKNQQSPTLSQPQAPTKEEWEKFEEYSDEWWSWLMQYDPVRYLQEVEKDNVGPAYN